MKKSIFVASLLFAGFAIAGSTTVTNDCILGVLPINIPSNRLEVILSVPWVAEGGVDGIAVSNFVKTAGLKAGDDTNPNNTKLLWYNPDSDGFSAWNLVSNNVDDVWINYWQEASEVDPANAVVKQGDAVILSFTNVTTSASTVYVVGQVGTKGMVTNTIAGAESESSPTYTLLAPPCGYTEPLDLNILFADSNIVEGQIDDKDEITTDIISGLPARYVRKTINEEKKWVFVYTGSDSNAVVPAGRGFWYKRCRTSDLKIEWSAPHISGN